MLLKCVAKYLACFKLRLSAHYAFHIELKENLLFMDFVVVFQNIRIYFSFKNKIKFFVEFQISYYGKLLYLI